MTTVPVKDGANVAPSLWLTCYNPSMKILIASDLYWPIINGVSTFSRNLAKGLAADGHEVIVVAPSQTGKKHIEVDGNYKIYRTNTITFPFYQNYKIALYPYREVKKIIDEFKPDIIHIQMLLMIGQAVMKYGNKKKIPIVSTNHIMPENLMDNLKMLAPVSRPINYAIKYYGMRFYSKANFVTMPTQAAIDMFVGKSEHLTAPVIAVSNGIDLSSFKPGEPSKEVLQKFNLPSNIPVIGFVGRVDAEKHISVLINAFKDILAEKDARLLVIGDGVDLVNLKKQVSFLDIADKVIFTGRVSEEDKVELLKAMSVFCMPSPVELQSIAMLEAMASGKPVVAVDAGALKELCQDRRNGFLCGKDDEKAIAKGLLTIISDQVLYNSFSRESLVIAGTHDLKRTIERFEGIYTNLINGRIPK